MTSLTEFKPNRRVYVKDLTHPLNSIYREMRVIRKAKKGFLCAIDDGTQQVFKASEIEVYPPEDDR